MPRYYDIDKLKKMIEARADVLVEGKEVFLYVAKWLDLLPSADVEEVRRGEWREVNEKYPRYVCTACNHLFNNKNYNYCPCCGAKMDGERNKSNE